MSLEDLLPTSRESIVPPSSGSCSPKSGSCFPSDTASHPERFQSSAAALRTWNTVRLCAVSYLVKRRDKHTDLLYRQRRRVCWHCRHIIRHLQVQRKPCCRRQHLPKPGRKLVAYWTLLVCQVDLHARSLTFWRRNCFFSILAHSVYKMWIIQEPNTLELWNKLHFEEKKKGEYTPCLKYSVPIFVE